MQYLSHFFKILFICVPFCITSIYARNSPTNVNDWKSASNSTTTELKRIYPIPGGEGVLVGGVKPISKERFDKVPYLKIERKTQLPESHDNGRSKYFPSPVVDQGQYGSCAQASGIGHIFTYSINVARDVEDPAYPHNYTWNFLNGGPAGTGSSFLDGWDIVNHSGCPKQTEWVNGISADTKWMTGYDDYYSAMKNRYIEYAKVDISTPDGIEVLKQWIYDYGDGSTPGGCAEFSVMCVPPMQESMQKLPSGSPEAGYPVVAGWGGVGGHAMVITGWHDGIKYDVNKDGEFTNDQDISGDGVVDMKDWEIGGWMVANSWGGNWETKQGHYCMLYRVGACDFGNAFADTTNSNNGTIVDYNAGGLSSTYHAWTLRAKLYDDAITRQMTYKIKMKHTERGNICIMSGISNDPADTEPEFTTRYSVFNYQGGAVEMQGENAGEDIEIGLDVRPLLNNMDAKKAKFFLAIESISGVAGEVESFSLMDYRGADVVEKVCDQTNVAIEANKTTYLSIEYEPEMAPLTIKTDKLPNAPKDKDYKETLEAEGGKSPYEWELLENVYYEVENTNAYPEITDAVSPNDTDDGFAECELDFDFPFFGETYKKLYVATDGHILFSPEFVYIRTQAALMAIKDIAVLGADYVITSSDGLYFKGESDKATFRWKTKNMWSETGLVTVDIDVACVIHASGKIEYFYKTLTGDITAMAMGASGGGGKSYYTFDYGSITDIPADFKSALVSEPVVAGMSMSEGGEFSGKPTDDEGTYRISFAVTDALHIKKVKAYDFTIGATGIKTQSSKMLTPLTIAKRANSSIIFSFGTTRNANASLEAFSLNGKKVQTVFNGKLEAGKHTMVWNNDGKKSDMISNGVYIWKLTVGKERVVRKIAIFK